MIQLYQILSFAIDAMIYLIIARAIASWLLAFGVIDPYHPAVRTVLGYVDRVLNPIFRPLQRVIPAPGGFDITPIIVLIALQFLRIALGNLLLDPVMVR